jgi:hypothetical protein
MDRVSAYLDMTLDGRLNFASAGRIYARINQPSPANVRTKGDVMTKIRLLHLPAYLRAFVLLSMCVWTMSAFSQSVTWQILPFPQDSNWGGSKGAPATTNGNVVTLRGQPVETLQVFTPPATFSFDVVLQTEDHNASDGAFELYFIPTGLPTNLFPTPYLSPRITYQLNGSDSLAVEQGLPPVELVSGIPFTVTTGTTYHVTLVIAANGQLTWTINGQTYVSGTVSVPFNQFQVYVTGWQPTDVWLMSNFTIGLPSTCPNLVGTWSGQMNVADFGRGYSTTPLSIQVTDQNTNGCLVRGYLTQGSVKNWFPNIRYGGTPWFRVPFTGTIPDGTTLLLNVGSDGSGKASAILDMSQTPPVLTKFIYQPNSGNTLTGDLTLQPSSP